MMRITFILVLWVSSLAAQRLPTDSLKASQTILMPQSFEPLDTTIYRLKAGDRLRIRNLNPLEIIYPQNVGVTVAASAMAGQTNNATFYETNIDRNGQITLPQVGRVKVAGLSKQETTTEIEKRYKNLITDPIFEVEIINLRIKVLGAVSKQGVYMLENEKMTLGEVIAMAGGVDFAVADKTIKLIRSQSQKQQEINFDIRNLSDPAVANILVFDGDYVFIPPSKGSLRNIKNQRIANILQPVALTLNAIAVVLGVYLTVRASQ